MPASSPTRDEVQTRGAQIRSRVDLSQADFDAKAEIGKTDDGTLASKRSLLKQAGKQVGKDAGATVDNVKDAVKDLLRK
jgi:conjugal transfer mating pair stabilization protein TraG